MNIKQKIFLTSGIICIIIIFLFWSGVKTLVLEIKKASALAKESQQRLLSLEKTDQNYLKQLETDYKEISNNLTLLKSGLIDSNQAVSFFMALEEAASSTSNKIEIKAEDFPSLNIELIGSFPNLMRFLGWLENGKYFLEIDSIQTRAIGEREIIEGFSPGDVKTTLKLKIYTKD
ncbi:MAG: hypothetical protein ACOZAL_00130 [Patescibacteria group bacterium]